MALNLYEELYLLAIHEEKGTILAAAEANLPYAITGALLAELALMGKIQINDRHRLEVKDPGALEDEFLNHTLQELASAEQPHKIGYWIDRLSDEPKKFFKHLADKLVQDGIVTREDKRLLWIVPPPGAPEPCGSAKFWLKTRLRKLALANQEADLHDLTLLNLAHACSWMDLIFTKDERKLASRRIYELLVSEAMRNPLAQAIEEIGSAIESVAEED
jgi:hypothetical protein